VTLHLSRLHALGAHVEMGGFSVYDRAYLLNVRIPAALGLAMGMADVETESRLLSAYITYLGHLDLLKTYG
jgi:hypothetical protein